MEIGTPLQITIVNENDEEVEEELGQYRSKLIDQNDEHLIIDYPAKVSTRRTTLLPTGTWLKVSYVDKNKNVYQFITKVVKKVKKQKILGLALEHPDEDQIKRIQRRNYVRIQTAVDIAIHSLDYSFLPFTTVTYDISGGGFSAIIPEHIELDSNMEIEVWIVLAKSSEEIQYIHAKAEVVLFRAEDKLRRSSFKFTEIDESLRQLIITYVFNKQREERRKGLV